MFGRWAFSVAGPAAWNSLPDYLRDPSRSFDSFSPGPENFSRTQRSRGFAVMRYISLLLTLTLTRMISVTAQAGVWLTATETAVVADLWASLAWEGLYVFMLFDLTI